MKTALALLAAAALLTGCAQQPTPVADAIVTQDDPDTKFAGAVQRLEVPVDGADPVAQDAAQEVCDWIKTGGSLPVIYSNIAEILGFTPGQAQDFTAASVYAYCPNAI